MEIKVVELMCHLINDTGINVKKNKWEFSKLGVILWGINFL